MTPKRQRLLYSAFIIITVAFFMYVLFPSDAVKKYILQKVNETYPGIALTVGDVKPVFPSGLTFRGVSVQYRYLPKLDAKQLTLTPGYFSLFLLRPTVSFKIRAYDGVIKGKLQMTRGKSGRAVKIATTIDGVTLTNIPIKGNQVSATIDGTITYATGQENGEALTSELQLSGCKLSLPSLPLSTDKLKEFTFKQIEIKAAADMQRFEIKQCSVQGDQLDGNLTGSVTIKNPMESSVLKFDGMVKPNPVFLTDIKKSFPGVDVYLQNVTRNDGIDIKLDGTMMTPAFSVGGFPLSGFNFK